MYSGRKFCFDCRELQRKAPAPHPPTRRYTPPPREVALMHGGQRPKTLEYQINCSHLSYLITGMTVSGEMSNPGNAVGEKYEIQNWEKSE